MKSWIKNLIETPQNMMEIGPQALIDLNEVSAVYREGYDLVIRIGGMGIIRFEAKQLHQSIDYTYKAMSKRLLK